MECEYFAPFWFVYYNFQETEYRHFVFLNGKLKEKQIVCVELSVLCLD